MGSLTFASASAYHSSALYWLPLGTVCWDFELVHGWICMVDSVGSCFWFQVALRLLVALHLLDSRQRPLGEITCVETEKGEIKTWKIVRRRYRHGDTTRRRPWMSNGCSSSR